MPERTPVPSKIFLEPIQKESEIIVAEELFLIAEANSEMDFNVRRKVFYYKGLPQNFYYQNRGIAQFLGFRLIILENATTIIQARITATDQTGEGGPVQSLKAKDDSNNVIYDGYVGEFHFANGDRLTQFKQTRENRVASGFPPGDDLFTHVKSHPIWTFNWSSDAWFENL